MTLSTAFVHLDANVEVNVEEGQPAPPTAKIERTNPRSARFMSLLPTKVIGRVYQQSAPTQLAIAGAQSVARSMTDSQWDSVVWLSSFAAAVDSDGDRPLSCRSVIVGATGREDTRVGADILGGQVVPLLNMAR